MECVSFLLDCVAWEWVALLYLDLCSKRFNFLFKFCVHLFGYIRSLPCTVVTVLLLLLLLAPLYR